MPRLPASFTKEIGSSLNVGPLGNISANEENTELRFPQSVRVYDQMRRTDSQISSTLRAISLLIRSTTWKALGSQVDQEVADFVESDLGLQKDQDGRVRGPESGFVWDDFLRQALLYIPIGFSIFESVYQVEETEDKTRNLGVKAHLSALPWRPHRTIQEFVVAENGALEGVYQWVHTKVGNQMMMERRFIQGDQLIVFCNEREGGDYAGQSSLRSCWLDWDIKTKLVKTNAIAHDRNGSGVVVYEYDSTAETGTEALAKARRIKSGEDAAVVVPKDMANVRLIGVEGATRDALDSIKYHNEAMGRALLAMVLNLGHDSGSYSLGQTMYDLFCSSLNAFTTYVSNVVTEEIVRPLVEMNFGKGVAYPAIVANPITPDVTLTPEQLVALVGAGIVQPDNALEEDRRQIYGLPAADQEKTDDISELPPPTPISSLTTAVEEPKMAASRAVDDTDAMRERAERLLQRIDARKAAETRNVLVGT